MSLLGVRPLPPIFPPGSLKRQKRPTDRVIRAGNSSYTAGNQGTAFNYIAQVPQTATNFQLDIGAAVFGQGAGAEVVYALVRIPEGYLANNLNYPSTTDDIYNPTKDVLISGILTSNQAEDHKFSKYSRKLAPGDQIALRILNSTGSSTRVMWELSFTYIS